MFETTAETGPGGGRRHGPECACEWCADEPLSSVLRPGEIATGHQLREIRRLEREEGRTLEEAKARVLGDHPGESRVVGEF